MIVHIIDHNYTDGQQSNNALYIVCMFIIGEQDQAESLCYDNITNSQVSHALKWQNMLYMTVNNYRNCSDIN